MGSGATIAAFLLIIHALVLGVIVTAAERNSRRADRRHFGL